MTTNEHQPKMGSKRSFDVAFLANSSKNERKEKSAFTKYETREDSLATPPTASEEAPLLRGVVSSPPATPTPNLMQFPALRKLLDITTGSGSGYKSTGSALTLPPVPEVANLGPILPPTLALGLSASNTCAKCGVTFRMTSDLVYHMRTHHSKSNQMSYEKKREGDRLKCNVCGENFRERHHLTRHMTAHQDRKEDGAETDLSSLLFKAGNHDEELNS